MADIKTTTEKPDPAYRIVRTRTEKLLSDLAEMLDDFAEANQLAAPFPPLRKNVKEEIEQLFFGDNKRPKPNTRTIHPYRNQHDDGVSLGLAEWLGLGIVYVLLEDPEGNDRDLVRNFDLKDVILGALTEAATDRDYPSLSDWSNYFRGLADEIDQIPDK